MNTHRPDRAVHDFPRSHESIYDRTSTPIVAPYDDPKRDDDSDPDEDIIRDIEEPGEILPMGAEEISGIYDEPVRD